MPTSVACSRGRTSARTRQLPATVPLRPVRQQRPQEPRYLWVTVVRAHPCLGGSSNRARFDGDVITSYLHPLAPIVYDVQRAELVAHMQADR
jgi:hypothetical protein